MENAVCVNNMHKKERNDLVRLFYVWGHWEAGGRLEVSGSGVSVERSLACE